MDRDYAVHRIPVADRHRRVLPSGPRRHPGNRHRWRPGVSPELVEALPALEIIAINGVGTDAVDLEHAKARGVRVTNTPDVLTDDVADMALALILATLRRICVGDRLVRAGSWGRAAIPLATKFSGKRLGILGLGRIGRAVARRAGGFDVGDRLHGPARLRRRTLSLRAFAGGPRSRQRHPGGRGRGRPASRRLVNREILDALGPKGILVNVARGSIVDEPALVEALREGRLGGAGLDVFEDEPQVPEAL